MIELKLISISKEELKPLIHFAYLNDDELIEKYQAGERTFDECVEFNYTEILEHLRDKVFKDDMYLWKVSLQSGDEIDDIGYCVTVTNEERPNILFSYAINIAYRKKIFLIDWLKAVEKLLGLPYYTLLWNKNTRAIDFFKKNNFKIIESNNGMFKYCVKGEIKKNKLWPSV